MNREDYRALAEMERANRNVEADLIRGRLWRAGSSLGTVIEVMLALTPHERAWLLQQAPAGGSIADALILLARDAYADDKEPTNAR